MSDFSLSLEVTRDGSTWTRANFTVSGETVTLADAAAAIAVRYAWENMPQCTLYAGAGAPGTGPEGAQPADAPGATGVAGAPFLIEDLLNSIETRFSEVGLNILSCNKSFNTSDEIAKHSNVSDQGKMNKNSLSKSKRFFHPIWSHNQYDDEDYIEVDHPYHFQRCMRNHDQEDCNASSSLVSSKTEDIKQEYKTGVENGKSKTSSIVNSKKRKGTSGASPHSVSFIEAPELNTSAFCHLTSQITKNITNALHIRV